jgi:hypothetical protein
MLDFVHWSAALLAFIGLVLWFWSGRIGVPKTASSGHFMARRQRQIRRVAICAAVISALLQAASASAPATERQDVELWASTAPADVSPVV